MAGIKKSEQLQGEMFQVTVDGKKVRFRATPNMMKKLDDIIEDQGIFLNRSECVRFLIYKFIESAEEREHEKVM